MESVFQITLNRNFDIQDCVNYAGHWCEFCDKDNGGWKFCYNCGKRESDDYDEMAEKEAELSLKELFEELEQAAEEPVKVQNNAKIIKFEGVKYLHHIDSDTIYDWNAYLEGDMESVGEWDPIKNRILFYDDDLNLYYDDDSSSDEEEEE